MTQPLAGDGSDIVGAGDGDPIIRAKWVMDGAATLAEAAAKIREFAGQLDRLHAEGWTLQEPIADDYAFLMPPASATVAKHGLDAAKLANGGGSS